MRGNLLRELEEYSYYYGFGPGGKEKKKKKEKPEGTFWCQLSRAHSETLTENMDS